MGLKRRTTCLQAKCKTIKKLPNCQTDIELLFLNTRGCKKTKIVLCRATCQTVFKQAKQYCKNEKVIEVVWKKECLLFTSFWRFTVVWLPNYVSVKHLSLTWLLYITMDYHFTVPGYWTVSFLFSILFSWYSGDIFSMWLCSIYIVLLRFENYNSDNNCLLDFSWHLKRKSYGYCKIIKICLFVWSSQAWRLSFAPINDTLVMIMSEKEGKASWRSIDDFLGDSQPAAKALNSSVWG